jgi:hypothetical protein
MEHIYQMTNAMDKTSQAMVDTISRFKLKGEKGINEGVTIVPDAMGVIRNLHGKLVWCASYELKKGHPLTNIADCPALPN